VDDGLLVGTVRSLWLGSTYGGVSVSYFSEWDNWEHTWNVKNDGMVKMDYTLEQDLEEPVPPNGTVAHLVFLGGLYLGGGVTGSAP
jgi:hypothetical protein